MTGAPPDPRRDPPAFLRSLFGAAVAAADPLRVLPAHLPPRPPGRVVVVGAGKASARMAEAVEAAWGPGEGLVVTRYGHARPCRGIGIVEAAHPVPDQRGVAATERILALLDGLEPQDFVLALISGGASALLCAPAPGVTLDEMQALNAALLASGAPIAAMNTVRKHLSRVKGGQLAAAAFPAPTLCLMMSDVPGDDPAVIGSGPTAGDGSTPAEALAILARWRIAAPGSVRRALERGSGVLAPGDPRLKRTENRIIAAPAQSLAAAARLARSAGCRVECLGDAVEGEAREAAADHARLALARRAARRPDDPPLLILSGGELTVTRRGDGIGGPNAEYALALAIALDGAPDIHAIACDTDGIDGAAEVAGAVIGPDTLDRATPDAARFALAGNGAHDLFGRIGAQVVTGPTLVNVNDFRAVLLL